MSRRVDDIDYGDEMFFVAKLKVSNNNIHEISTHDPDVIKPRQQRKAF